jgi:hypothetical protein
MQQKFVRRGSAVHGERDLMVFLASEWVTRMEECSSEIRLPLFVCHSPAPGPNPRPLLEVEASREPQFRSGVSAARRNLSPAIMAALCRGAATPFTGREQDQKEQGTTRLRTIAHSPAIPRRHFL